VEVVAVDPLADEYNALLDKHGMTPAVRARKGEAERLTELALGQFDLVYSRNALDHAYDPAVAIEQMLAVTSDNGAVFFEGAINEGENEGYQGLHQWNFEPAPDGDLSVWSRSERISMRERLGPNVKLTSTDVGGWHHTEIVRVG
jgi:SAM-dependent methyltransferase